MMLSRRRCTYIGMCLLIDIYPRPVPRKAASWTRCTRPCSLLDGKHHLIQRAKHSTIHEQFAVAVNVFCEGALLCAPFFLTQCFSFSILNPQKLELKSYRFGKRMSASFLTPQTIQARTLPLPFFTFSSNCLERVPTHNRRQCYSLILIFLLVNNVSRAHRSRNPTAIP